MQSGRRAAFMELLCKWIGWIWVHDGGEGWPSGWGGGTGTTGTPSVIPSVGYEADREASHYSLTCEISSH